MCDGHADLRRGTDTLLRGRSMGRASRNGRDAFGADDRLIAWLGREVASMLLAVVPLALPSSARR
jgi:hypothetical protein